MMINANELPGTPFIKNYSEYFNDGYPIFDWQLTYAENTEPLYDYFLGDVNNDGTVDIEDAVAIISHVNGINALF